MTNLLRKTAIPIIIIGTFISSIVLLGLSTDITIISKETTLIGDYRFTYYVFNIHQYLKNLENSLKGSFYNTSLFGDLPIPPKTPNWANVADVLKYIVNILIFILNYILAILNIILLGPIKLILYPINLLITLIGINTSDQGYIVAIQKIMNFNIKYIIYLT